MNKRISLLFCLAVLGLMPLYTYANEDVGTCTDSECAYKYSDYPTRSCNNSEQWKDNYYHTRTRTGTKGKKQSPSQVGSIHCDGWSGWTWGSQCKVVKTLTGCTAGYKFRRAVANNACFYGCQTFPNQASWTGDGYAEQCNLYTCQANYVEVGNNTGNRCDGTNGNACKRGARCVVPSSVAPNSEAKISCAGLKNFITSGGATKNSSEYKLIVRKDGTTVYQTDWKAISGGADELSAYNSGDEWVDFPEYSDGSYTAECRIKYAGDAEEYTATCGFNVDPNGTSCDNLSFDPDVIPINGTTTATCEVSNAKGGQRRIRTDYEQGPQGWTTFFFSTNTLLNYVNTYQVSSYNTYNSFSANGTYYSFCSAVANVTYDGFQNDGYVPTYQLVTSAACGSSDPTIPIYVGESYCSDIQLPSLTYVDTAFNVTCQLDTAATSTPTAYDIVSINDSGANTVLKSGTIPAGATSVTDSIQLSAGSHTIGCLIKGPENTSYVDQNCKEEVIPEEIPTGSCQPGDDITNAVLCSGDDTGVGADIPAVVVDACTTSRKCEYTCNPATHVRSGNACVPKAQCINLTVPSHIRPGRDYSLVQCQGDSNTRYFRYKVSGPGVNYTSPAFPTDTSGYGEALYENFLPDSGTYEVSCYVGSDANSISFDGVLAPACKQDIISDPNAPFCKRLDRYIVGGDINYNDSLPVGETIQYTCVAQPGSPSLGNSNDVFRIRYQTPGGMLENVGGPVFNIPPMGFPVFQGQQMSLAYGNHFTSCLVKIGSGYSTSPECGDRLCSSDTGKCSEPVCQPGDNVCCANELNGSGICCRLDPLHPSCDTPMSYPPTDMMRRICTNTNSTNVLIGCYDETCTDYGIDSSTTLSFNVLTNPYLDHGALIFATVDLGFVSEPVPLYVRDGNGIISTRYLYWESSDIEDPTSGGFRYYTSPNSSEIFAPRWINSDVKITIDCKDGLGRAAGVDTLFCGCDIPDTSGFQAEYATKTVTRNGSTETIQDEDNVVFSRVISENESGSLEIKDTAGNEASGSPYTYNIDWIDKEVPGVIVETSAGPIGSVDRSVVSSADITVVMTDTISGIVDYDVKTAPATTLIDAVSLDCTATGATYPNKGQVALSVTQTGVATDRAIFVCAKDAAGNITKRKFTFGGTRVINYFQGPVMGFSYSGETGVSNPDSYEDKLINRVESKRVAVNDTYNTQEGSRISCQNTAIEQNIDVLARGRLNPNTSNLVITSLATDQYNNTLVGTNQKNSDGIIYYSFDSTGGDVDGNTGKVVELSGDNVTLSNWNYPINGPYSTEVSNTFRKVSIDGLKTLIIDGGNLYINADMYYEDPQSMLVIIVKRGTPSIHGHSQGGNVYIDKDVTNVNGLIFADGAIVNVEETGTGSLDVLSSYNEEDVEKLRRQLLIYGSLATSNTRGGSLKVDSTGNRIAYKISEYDGQNGNCPYGTDKYRSNGSNGFENCAIQDAAKYDLETFRTFNLGFGDAAYRLNQAIKPQCGGSQCACVSNAHERIAVGGIGTTTVIPDYFNSTTYALSGKRKCFYSDTATMPDSRLETTNEYYATYVKFDTRDLKYQFPILSEGTCH